MIDHLADDAHCLQQHSPCLQQVQCDSLCLADCSPVFPISCVHALKREDNYLI